MKKTLSLILFLSILGLAFTSESLYRRRATREDPPADQPKEGAAPAEGADAAPAKPVKIDKIAILTPEIEPDMANKPQIIITRTGDSKPSELVHHQLKANDPCSLRQGYVLIQTNLDETGANPILYTKPSFCVLNKKTISFFDSENVHTLIVSYELSDVIANPKENFWLKSNCIPLYKAKRDHKGEIVDGYGSRTSIFCTEDELQAKDWIQAVNTFHKCTLEEISLASIPGKKIKTTIKRGGLESDEDLEEKRLKEYNNESSSYESSSEEENTKENHEMERMSKELMEEFRRHKEMEAKERARLREERKRINEKAGIIGAQARCIEQALQVKSLEDEKTLEELLDEMKMDKERNIWKTATKRLEYMWKLESENMHSQESDLKKAEYEIREKMKKDLIQETAEWTKNLDPYDCYSNKLTGGNVVKMKAVCANMIDYGAAPDLKKFLDCLNPKFFCQTCCGYYIGASNEGDRIKCEQRCKPVMNAEANAYNVDFKKRRRRRR